MSSFAEKQVRQTKSEMVFGKMRQQILDGERPYGQTFSTYELADEFGVSRRPVMDALFRLQSAGLVEIVSQVGCRVVVPSKDDVRDHIEVTIALHSMAAELAAERSTPEQLALIHERLEKLEKVVSSDDVQRYQELNMEFHDAILQGSNNARLILLAQRAWDLTRFLGYLGAETDLSSLQADHHLIAEALENRDAQGARAAMEAHQVRAKERLESQPAGREKAPAQPAA